MFVPESSAREAKPDVVSAIFVKASTTTVSSLMAAGSAVGPTTRNELCMTSVRSIPEPLATSSFSAAGEWTSRTSALPSSPSLMASPLPTATVFTT